MSKSIRGSGTFRYRCCCCEMEFTVTMPGASTCPRCSSIGGHELVESFPPEGPR
ncbi:hypothetical protein VB779_09445 [Haloarculaceae archaeon H-GB11]|nr:hypothetical protein [Haloarculaceae archaeon H-GB11]